MDETKTGRKPMHIGGILTELLHHHRSERVDDFDAIWDAWQETVGEVVAANTRPEALKGGILLVYVSNSVWMHQLQFLQDEMIANINRRLGKKRVGELNFKIGPVSG